MLFHLQKTWEEMWEEMELKPLKKTCFCSPEVSEWSHMRSGLAYCHCRLCTLPLLESQVCPHLPGELPQELAVLPDRVSHFWSSTLNQPSSEVTAVQTVHRVVSRICVQSEVCVASKSAGRHLFLILPNTFHVNCMQ